MARAKGAGDRALAERIGALRRPTVAAYALNLLARAQPEQVEHLRELGRGLRDAQSRLQGSRLRELAVQRNALVTALTEQARRVAAQAGQSVGDQAAAEVDQTLRAVLADEQAADALAAGRLVQGLVPGSTLPDPPVGAPSRRQPRSVREPAVPRPDPEAEERRRRLAEAEARLRELDAEQHAATTAVGRLRTAADNAAEQRRTAAERLRRAEHELAAAREALTAAEQRAAEADTATATAEHRLEQAQRRVDEQTAAVARLRRA